MPRNDVFGLWCERRPDWRASISIDARGLLSRVAEGFRSWRQRARQWDEVAELERNGEFGPMLAELGITYGQFKAFMRAHPRAARQRAAMTRWLGVDLTRPSATREVRDIEWRCLQCSTWRECRSWLASPEEDRPLPTFCPNMDTFNRLVTAQRRADADHTSAFPIV